MEKMFHFYAQFMQTYPYCNIQSSHISSPKLHGLWQQNSGKKCKWNTEMCLNYNAVVLSLCSHFTWHTTRSNYLHEVQCSLRSSQPTDNISMFHKKLKISYHLDPFLPSGLFQWSCETKTALGHLHILYVTHTHHSPLFLELYNIW